MKDSFYEEHWRLGLSVLYFRRSRGLTQEQLAEKMDINYETISRIENANTAPSTDTLFALAKAMNITLAELFAHAGL